MPSGSTRAYAREAVRETARGPRAPCAGATTSPRRPRRRFRSGCESGSLWRGFSVGWRWRRRWTMREQRASSIGWAASASPRAHGAGSRLPGAAAGLGVDQQAPVRALRGPASPPGARRPRSGRGRSAPRRPATREHCPQLAATDQRQDGTAAALGGPSGQRGSATAELADTTALRRACREAFLESLDPGTAHNRSDHGRGGGRNVVTMAQGGETIWRLLAEQDHLGAARARGWGTPPDRASRQVLRTVPGATPSTRDHSCRAGCSPRTRPPAVLPARSCPAARSALWRRAPPQPNRADVCDNGSPRERGSRTTHALPRRATPLRRAVPPVGGCRAAVRRPSGPRRGRGCRRPWPGPRWPIPERAGRAGR